VRASVWAKRARRAGATITIGGVVELAKRHGLGAGGTNVRYELPPSDSMRLLSEADASLVDAVWEVVREEIGGSHRYYTPVEVSLSDLRVALATRRPKEVDRALRAVARSSYGDGPLLLETLGPELDAWSIACLAEHGADYADRLLFDAAHHLDAAGTAIVEWGLEQSDARFEQALEVRVLRGEPVPAGPPRKRARLRFEHVRRFWDGDYLGAYEAGRAAVAALPKTKRKRTLDHLAQITHALSCVVAGAWTEIDAATKGAHPEIRRALFHLESVARGRDDGEFRARWRGFSKQLDHEELLNCEITLVVALVVVWTGVQGTVRKLLTTQCRLWSEWCARWGYARPGQQFEALLVALRGEAPPEGTLVAAYRKTESWRVALESLAKVADGFESKAPERHVRWVVRLGNVPDARAELEPRMMTPRSRTGKRISLDALLRGDVSEATDADRRVLARIVQEPRDAWSRHLVTRLADDAILALVDHPHVARPDGTRLRISRGTPRLRVERSASELAVRVEPEALNDATWTFVERAHAHVEVFERTPELAAVAQALQGEARIPLEAEEQVAAVLSKLGERMAIAADGDVAIDAEQVDADGRIHAVLHWSGTSLSVRLRVAPFGPEGPLMAPGAGSATIVENVGGRPLRAVRDLAAEVAASSALLALCSTLADRDDVDGERHLETLSEALEVLHELSSAQASLLWPRGEKLRPPLPRSKDDVKIAISSGQDWLHADLRVPIDETEVLGMREVLKRRRGRFVELDDGKYLRLSTELTKQLEALESLGAVKKTGVQIPTVALPVLADLSEGLSREIDTAAKARLDALEDARRMRPRPPKGFSAKLRGYQREGFEWMAKLAAAGLGACLADDMGLGKTVQTLAILQRRRGKPQLVVAPTSVARNWIDEGRKFAPKLRMHLLSEAKDREELFESLRGGDVLVCSYGRLATEAERLEKLELGTVVFDEAHYLKNARTKRARAAARLQSDFRITLTGTPIENHLGELWSLMQVTVPGLLGSEKRFEERFRKPIEDGDGERARELRALIRPFLLRRTKAEVLDELPPRTEVTFRVTPEPKERAFYEALRRDASEKVAGAKGAAARLEILAQITRLRQAAVDPRLVTEDAPAGAKIAAIVERVEALREEGHRALVFTQFLGSMALLEAAFSEVGVEVMLLDGSTPGKERAKRIAAFQSGEGHVFLMSLKAGGIGVNLTGADYVIHADPWWNPAVEEQATARSHRMGQARPVTVYRMVTEGTIEEKILALHAKKRELADDLLSNMDKAKALDVETLRALM